ncbi:hypothetical protein IE90_14220 [Sanguibacteroides justesenii]|uniref:Uncharacterized protein n=1 Tax=Sanguibacteroides justesenii TaxID=1547597 RepID=A0AB34QZS5_9PORP|nr:hypothetical protein IE90_14220 [Sanguibacteroides justesenii]
MEYLTAFYVPRIFIRSDRFSISLSRENAFVSFFFKRFIRRMIASRLIFSWKKCDKKFGKGDKVVLSLHPLSGGVAR